MSNEKNIKSDFIEIFKSVIPHENYHRIFYDFIHLSSFSLQNVFLKSQEVEKRYMEISNNYTKSQLLKFSHLFACVVEALEEKPHDFLGDIYMSLELGNKNVAQFFTPYNVSLLLALMTFNNEEVKNKNYVTVNDPACGAGSMLIAFSEIMKKNNHNPQIKMLAYAKDIDSLSARMCYIQLSLLGIPAIIDIGDTLKLTTKERLYTSFYWLNSHRYKNTEENQQNETTKEITTGQYIEIKKELEQLNLII